MKKGIFISLLLAPFLFVGGIWATLPNAEILLSQYPVVHMGPKGESHVEIVSKRPGGWVSVGEVSKSVLGAILVSEDWAFYSHSGIDLKQIREAAEANWRKKRYARGASTITQQVARNIFLSKDKKLIRKIREIFLALSMERKLTKKKILELYINIAEWGPGIYGIGPASKVYFSTSSGNLGPKEGAFLAMLLPNPKLYSQSFRRNELTPFARKRIGEILDRMAQAGLIASENLPYEKERALSFESVPVETLPPPEVEEGQDFEE